MIDKNEAHAIFDRLWKSGRMTREQAYQWAADVLGIPRSVMHMARLGPDRRAELVRWVNHAMRTIQKPRRGRTG